MINAKTSSKKTLLQIVLFFLYGSINLLKKCNPFWTDVPKYMDVL